VVLHLIVAAGAIVSLSVAGAILLYDLREIRSKILDEYARQRNRPPSETIKLLLMLVGQVMLGAACLLVLVIIYVLQSGAVGSG
jgi:hypothetical protein